jgi:thiosulfate dehydrogenase [quinone] large subunit
MIDVLDHDRGTSAPPSRQTLPPPVPRHAPTQQPGHHLAVVGLLPLRLFLAAGWLRAGAEKLIDSQWWNGNKLHTYLKTQHETALPFFRPIMDHGIAPAARLVAIVVVVTELAIGLAIAIGKPLRLALRWGFFLNVIFIMTGTVNPSAFYLVMEMVLLFAIADGVIGVRPSSPSWRTLALAGVSAAATIAMVPYVRTIEPAQVIHDPAIMLAFIGTIVTATMVVRRAAYRPPNAYYFRRLWTTWYAGWIHAKPKMVVRGEYERRYCTRSTGFAPPSDRSAMPLPPPLPGTMRGIPAFPRSDARAN